MIRDYKVAILFVGGPQHGRTWNVVGPTKDVLENKGGKLFKHRYEEKMLPCGRWIMEHKYGHDVEEKANIELDSNGSGTVAGINAGRIWAAEQTDIISESFGEG